MTNATFQRNQNVAAMIEKDPNRSYQDYLALINRYDLPEGFAYLDGLRGYVFITRPDLNLFTSKNVLNDRASTILGFNEFAGSKRGPDPINLYMAKMLQRNTGYPSSFILPMTNKCKGYSPDDQRLDVLEFGESMHGIRMKYGRHSIASRTSGNISITFEDDKYLTIYKLVSLWMEYIELVYLGDLSPTNDNIKQNILDYAVSLFFLVVRNTGEPVPVSPGAKATKCAYEIVFWEKLTGVFPSSRPDSSFAYNREQFINPEFTVQFEYAMRSKSGFLDPMVLSEFNTMNKWQHSLSSDIIPSYTQFTSADGSGRKVQEPGLKYVNAASIFRVNGKFFLEWV